MVRAGGEHKALEALAEGLPHQTLADVVDEVIKEERETAAKTRLVNRSMPNFKLVEEHTLPRVCPAGGTDYSAHHLVITKVTAVWNKKMERTVQRFRATCKFCGGEDRWGTVDMGLVRYG